MVSFNTFNATLPTAGVNTASKPVNLSTDPVMASVIAAKGAVNKALTSPNTRFNRTAEGAAKALDLGLGVLGTPMGLAAYQAFANKNQ